MILIKMLITMSGKIYQYEILPIGYRIRIRLKNIKILQAYHSLGVLKISCKI